MTRLLVSFGAALVVFVVLTLAVFPWNPQGAITVDVLKDAMLRNAVVALIVFAVSMLAFRLFRTAAKQG